MAGLQTYTLLYEPVSSGLDTMPPVSTVAALPSASFPAFSVTWSGADETNGSGLAFFDVFVSVNGGPFSNWISRTTAQGALFQGQAGSTYAFFSRAADNQGNVEPAPASAQATTAASLVNTPPTLSYVSVTNVDEGVTVSLSPVVSDADIPQQLLTFALLGGAPAGLTVDPATGQVQYPTGEATGPSTNRISVRVTDDGVPALSATSVIDIVVREVNQAPVLPAIANRTIVGQTNLAFTVAATDGDRPFNTIVYALVPGAPDGASINTASGLFSWTPAPEQVPGAYTLAVTATDNGAPPLSVTQTFAVVVKQRPVLSWSNPAPMVRGTPLTTNQLNATADVPGTFTYNPPPGSLLPVGVQSLRVTLTPDDLDVYVAVTASVSVVVEPSPQVIDFPAVSGVTATSVVPLAATASSGLPVSFEVLAGPAVLFGNQLSLGGFGTVQVVARQDGNADWLPAAPVTNVIEAAPLTIDFTWPMPEPVLFGAPLSEVQLNASASITGVFVYTPGAGTVLPAGTNVLSAAFTPSDLTLYAVSTIQVAWVIQPFVLIQPGQLVLRRGDSGELAIGASAGGAPYAAGLDSASFQLQVTTGALQGVAFVADPLLASVGVTNITTNLFQVSVQALPGQVLPVTGAFVRLQATMPLAEATRRIPVRVLEPAARDTLGREIGIVQGGQGFIILTGDEPLFGQPDVTASDARLPVYVAPGSWRLEFTTNILGGDGWLPVQSFGDDGNLKVLLDTDPHAPSKIYRVIRVDP